MPYIYSTSSSDNEFRFFNRSPDGKPIPNGGIVIRGGANVANKNFITPRGVVTTVSEEVLERLKTHPVFQRMVDKGFLSHRNDKVDPEKQAAEMATRDLSAQAVDEDFESEGALQPISNATGSDDEPSGSEEVVAPKAIGGKNGKKAKKAKKA
jgi:hypothetical protein